jgi:hypothetical protein
MKIKFHLNENIESHYSLQPQLHSIQIQLNSIQFYSKNLRKKVSHSIDLITLCNGCAVWT